MSAMRHSNMDATGSTMVMAHSRGSGLKCARHFSSEPAMLATNRQPTAVRMFSRT